MLQVRLDPSFARQARKLFAKHPDKGQRVERALTLLAENPRHPSLATKKYDEAQGIWQSYVEQRTPSAWRIWWRYAEDGAIVVLAFGPHP